MSQSLLWVNHNAGPDKSSQRREEALKRSHAQAHRPKPVATASDDDKCNTGEDRKLQPMECVRGVPASSLKPSKSLGRLAVASTKTATTRKRRRKIKDDPQSNKSISPETTTTLTKSLPFLWHGLSSDERRSLAFFELRTSQEWTGWEDSHFWNVLALQVSQQSQAVARSLIAVSALHEGMETVGSVERTRLSNLSNVQSSQATRALLAKSEMPYFEALVSCLVMICFHGLRHSKASFMLLRSGMKLLDEANSAGCTSFEERQMIDQHLRPLLSRLLSRPCLMGDVYGAFTLSTERHRSKGFPIAREPLVPLVFHTLLEARDCLQTILDWAHDHVPSPCQPAKWRVHFLPSLHRLKTAWETTLARSDFSKTIGSIRSRKLLRAACLIGVIIVETAHCTQETASDSYQAEFEEITMLVEGAKATSHSFGIDAGLIDIIALVGSKCRDPEIRRRALRLLQSENRLEGDRIASNPATIMEALIALEERGLDVKSCHDIPESNRRVLVCGQQHIAQGRIDLFYASADGSQKERCCVTLAGISGGRMNKKLDPEEDVPDAIFGTGYAAYLEDRQTKSYFRLELDRFYFPIPKV